jgi:hypothetical protein
VIDPQGHGGGDLFRPYPFGGLPTERPPLGGPPSCSTDRCGVPEPMSLHSDGPGERHSCQKTFAQSQTKFDIATFRRDLSDLDSI